MGTRPKIIEFYGLPGCGKTTLCNALKEIYESKGFKVGTLPDATNQFSSVGLFHLLSLRDCFFLFKFYRSFINNNVYKSLVLSPIRRLLIYRYAKRKEDYDFLFIDHGAVQSVVRVLYEVENPLEFLKTPIVSDYYSMIPADMYINCRISSDEAFSRVRIRNRKNSGTFDQYPDEQLKQVLKGHITIFNNTEAILKNLDKKIYTIDCSVELDKCLSQVEKNIIIEYE